MTAAWRNSTAHSSAKRVATVDATPSESARNEFAIENGCPREALFKYLVRSKSFVITSRRNRSGNRFRQWRDTSVYGGGRLNCLGFSSRTRRGNRTILDRKPGHAGRRGGLARQYLAPEGLPRDA